jgi:hypothetical protein
VEVQGRIFVRGLGLVRIPNTFGRHRCASFLLNLEKQPLDVEHTLKARETRLLLSGAFGEQVSVSNIVDLDVFGKITIVGVFWAAHTGSR